MGYLLQCTLLYKFWVNITKIRTWFNQNQNRFVINHTFHLEDWCLVIGLLSVPCSIYVWHILSHIIYFLCFFYIVKPWTISLSWRIVFIPMVFSTSPTLHRSSSKPLSFISCRLWELVLIRNSKFLLKLILYKSHKLHIRSSQMMSCNFLPFYSKYGLTFFYPISL